MKADSFFNFFDPPQVPDDPKAEVDEETQALLTADFEIGHYIKYVHCIFVFLYHYMQPALFLALDRYSFMLWLFLLC